MLEETLKVGADALGIALADDCLPQFRRYYELLVEWNERFNLTRITNEDEAAVKHMLDSLSALRLSGWDEWRSLADVGSGAGFPGIPLKIVRPALEVTLIEATAKKVGFLTAVVKELGLEGVDTVHGRGEECGRRSGFRERFDVVTARAVAKLNALVEYCLPLTAVGGRFIAFKGPEGAEEAENAGRACAVLGGAMPRLDSFELPEESGRRTLVVVEKVRRTPAGYPRPTAQIVKRPL